MSDTARPFYAGDVYNKVSSCLDNTVLSKTTIEGAVEAVVEACMLKGLSDAKIRMMFERRLSGAPYPEESE